MHKIAVVALDIREILNPSAYEDYKQLSFDKKLELIQQKIEAILAELAIKENDADEWVISWREYGLQKSHMRYIDMVDRANLKVVMAALTAKYPKLTIISGTVATVRITTSLMTDKHDEKLSKVQEGYAENKKIFQDDRPFKAHRKQSRTLIAKKHVGSAMIVRNTSYVFHAGKCIARHDKSAPFTETEGLPKDFVMFRPGRGRSKPALINDRYAIEICREHDVGLLATQLKTQKQAPPKIQFVLSASITILPWNIACPYMVHLDSYENVSLITEDKNNSGVVLYKYNLFENDKLVPVAARPAREVVISNLLNQASNGHVPEVDEYIKHDYFTAAEAEQFLEILLKMILLKDIDKKYPGSQYGPLDYIDFRVSRLMRYFNKLNVQIDPRLKLLQLAAFGTSVEVATQMNSVDLRTPHPVNKALLFMAVRGSHCVLLQKLLDEGFNQNETLIDGRSLLMLAVECNAYTTAIKLAEMQGININYVAKPGNETALSVAANKGDEDMIAMLLRNGALLDSTNFTDKQFVDIYLNLTRVVMQDQEFMSATLTLQGETLLHLAAVKEDLHIVSALIAHGIEDINKKNQEGLTALHIAAATGNKDVVLQLLNAGADPCICDNDGVTPAEVAKIEAGEHHESTQLLLQHENLYLNLQFEKLRILNNALLNLSHKLPATLAGQATLIKSILQVRDKKELRKLFDLTDQVKQNAKIFNPPATVVTRLDKLIRQVGKSGVSLDKFKINVNDFIQDIVDSPQPKQDSSKP